MSDRRVAIPLGWAERRDIWDALCKENHALRDAIDRPYPIGDAYRNILIARRRDIRGLIIVFRESMRADETGTKGREP